MRQEASKLTYPAVPTSQPTRQASPTSQPTSPIASFVPYIGLNVLKGPHHIHSERFTPYSSISGNLLSMCEGPTGYMNWILKLAKTTR